MLEADEEIARSEFGYKDGEDGEDGKGPEESDGELSAYLEHKLTDHLSRNVIMEREYLLCLVNLYGNFIQEDAKLGSFMEGLREQSGEMSSKDLSKALQGDGFTSDQVDKFRVEFVKRVSRGKDVIKAVISELDYQQLRGLLKFWTGSSQLGGQLSVDASPVSDDHLPVAHTCFNTLDIPSGLLNPGRADLLRSKLMQAVSLGGVGTGMI